MKICKHCGESKSLDQFSTHINTKDRLYPWCKKCSSEHNIIVQNARRKTDIEYAKKYGKVNNERRRKKYANESEYRTQQLRRAEESRLKRVYGITQVQYDQMLKDQNGVCKICGYANPVSKKGTPRALAVDHDHISGKIRGLLCNSCNSLLGHAHDNCDLLRAALKYLGQSTTKC